MRATPLAAAAATALAALLTFAAPAAAQPHHYTSATATSPAAVTYHGGPLQTAPQVYLDFWGPQWQTGFSANCQLLGIFNCYTSGQAEQYITGFASALGGSRWEQTLTQYGVTNPAAQYRGWWIDTTAVPSSYGDTQIQQAAARAAQRFATTSPNADIIVITPHGHSAQGAFQTYWAYHTATPAGLAYTYMPYMPDCSSCENNYVNKTDDSYGHGIFDGFSIAGGHEIAETITDPRGGGWWGPGGEVGDPCQPHGTPGRNVTLTNGQYYAMQPLWSNTPGGCTFG